MSKTKLAILVFVLAFGVNIAAFLLSHKTFMVEESKNVWLYEIPLSPSPLDAYAALDIGPHQGVVGTLFRPDHSANEHPLQALLADHWSWDDKTHTLSIELKRDLKYSNGDAILPEHFVKAHEFIASRLSAFSDSSNFGELKNSTFAATPNGLTITLKSLPNDFDLETFMNEALTHPLSGVIHPKNLADLIAGKKIDKDWISSGPYLLIKWSPKEIELISRNDFPVTMRKDFVRTLKFQSAPIKNPSCDYLQGRVGDEKNLTEQKLVDSNARETILWACRSFEQDAFCKDRQNRKILSELISGKAAPTPELLKGKTLRYRIPVGSDAFRQAICSKLETVVTQAGGKIEETSYFFKNSKDTDLELVFVTTSNEDGELSDAIHLAALSSRFGPNAAHEPDLMGVIEAFPLELLFKGAPGEAYSKVFLEPDLDEKKLPL